MTVTLSPEIERALTEESARRGTTPEQILENALRNQFATSAELEAEELRARVKAARGMFSHISGGSYEFMRNKVYEKLLEERHW